MLEPAVTLTDYGLTIECWLLAALIARQAKTDMSRWWIVFFANIGAASLLGGTVHGFLPDQASFMHQTLWNLNMLAIGGTAVATWNLASLLTKSEALHAYMPKVALVLAMIYALVVFFVSNRFFVAIAMYLPATVFLTITMSVACIRDRQRGWEPGILGLLLTFTAAAVQQLKVVVHPAYFDHNALYHLIQAVALFLLYYAQKNVVRPAIAL
jgi:hypothetical protein